MDSFSLRYTAIVASTTLLMVTGVASPFSPDFYTFSALRFVMGMTFYSFCFLFHVLGKYKNSSFYQLDKIILLECCPLVMESVSMRWRSLVINVGFSVGATIAGLIEPWILW